MAIDVIKTAVKEIVGKKSLEVFLLCCCVSISLSAQNYSNQRKPNDFLLNVFGNPTFRLYDFLCVGLNGNTAEFLSEETYYNHPRIKSLVLEKYGDYNYELFHKIYIGLNYSWKTLLEVQHCDLDEMLKYMTEYGTDNIYAKSMQQNCPYPELRDNLQIVPLKIVESLFRKIICKEVVLKPNSATIKDNYGHYSSTHFNCPSMSITDNDTFITIDWNGEKLRLSRDPNDKEVYFISQIEKENVVSFTAYRDVLTKRINLVIVKMTEGNNYTTIEFK